MDRCKLIQPVPAMGRVLPKGMVVDAPDAYKKRLVASGRAVWLADVQAQQDEGSRAKSPAPVSAQNGSKVRRRAVK